MNTSINDAVVFDRLAAMAADRECPLPPRQFYFDDEWLVTPTPREAVKDIIEQQILMAFGTEQVDTTVGFGITYEDGGVTVSTIGDDLTERDVYSLLADLGGSPLPNSVKMDAVGLTRHMQWCMVAGGIIGIIISTVLNMLLV
jgi:hypothetical protein